MRRLVTIVWIAAAAACLASAGWASAPAITRQTIAGARIGLPEVRYRQLLGPRVIVRGHVQPAGWAALIFPSREVSVYLAHGRTGTGTVITTWNRAYRTSAGVGPCTSIARLRAVYGKAVRPSNQNTIGGVVFAWTLGRTLLFTSNGLYVRAVALYAGGDPRRATAGGPLSYAASIAIGEPDPVCP